MKRILYLIAATALIIGCGEKNGGADEPEKTLEELVCGEWHSTSLPVKADVYLGFAEDKTFELYQQIGEGAYRLYRGTWNIEENILTGKYNDGEDWAAAYTVVMNDKYLTLTSRNDAAEETVYVKSEIPSEVRETCETVVKSNEGGL